jgi:hypothetical protein
MRPVVQVLLGFAAGLLAGWLHGRRDPYERGPHRT